MELTICRLRRFYDASIKKIGLHRDATPSETIPPKYFAQFVICELLNVFPPRVSTPDHYHYSLWFGIRPVLYAILSREFQSNREVELCANPKCRAYFTVERKGQKCCTAECSRQHRQREYWGEYGKALRKKRINKKAKG